ncbi:MAG: hypothetical protein QOD53_573, partial [Thermoleophilaceae bacterium]|nr:hypothetical protein [Thermoleophilaceae bacterium]
ELTVVVPTRDRAGVLERCLDSIAAQRVEGLQVVVADDGSGDRTSELLAARGDVEALELPPGGRSAARNAALRQARGRLVLFLDDDVLATDGLLARHLDHHARHPAEHEALVGPVTWAPELRITPHMQWLERGGPLFAFDTIDDPEHVDWHHFCTANVSVKRAFLDPDPFDEALERSVDVELGYRLARRGMRLRYDPAALVHHLRTDTPATTERRMLVVGRSARRMHRKHPEIAEPPPAFRRLTPLKAALARGLAPIARGAGFAGLDERVWEYRGARAYARGYAERGPQA